MPAGLQAERGKRHRVHRLSHRPAQGNAPAGHGRLQRQGGFQSRNHEGQADAHQHHHDYPGIDGAPAQRDQAGHRPGARRYHDLIRGRARSLLPADSRRPCGSRAAHGQHLLSLPRRNEPSDDGPDQHISLRPHREKQEQSPGRGNLEECIRDWEYRHRRVPVHGKRQLSVRVRKIA